MRLEVDRSLHHVVRPDHPANTPTGHRVGLSNTVDDDALVRNLGHQRGHRDKTVLAVGEVFVDLVGDDPDALLDSPAANGLDLFGRIHGAAGVVWRHEQQHLGATGERCIELFYGDPESGLFGGFDNHRNTASESDGFGIRGPVRGRQNHFVAWVAQCCERREHCVLAATCDQHLVGSGLKAAVAQGLHSDGLTQLGQTSGWCVAMVLDVATCSNRCFNDVLWRREVGLARAETDDVLASGLERLGLGVNGKRGRLSDRGQSLRRAARCYKTHGGRRTHS